MKRSDRRSSRGKNGDDTGWVRLKLPIATDPGQIQYAVDRPLIRPKKPPIGRIEFLLQKIVSSLSTLSRSSWPFS